MCVFRLATGEKTSETVLEIAYDMTPDPLLSQSYLSIHQLTPKD